MPTYEYECPKCGHFEAFHKISDEPLKAKPDCSDPDCPRAARRLVSGGNFVLKGGGWYVTDYARQSKEGKSKGSSAASSKSTDQNSGGTGTEKKNSSTGSESAGSSKKGES